MISKKSPIDKWIPKPKKRKLKTAAEFLKEYPLSPSLSREINRIEEAYKERMKKNGIKPHNQNRAKNVRHCKRT